MDYTHRYQGNTRKVRTGNKLAGEFSGESKFKEEGLVYTFPIKVC